MAVRNPELAAQAAIMRDFLGSSGWLTFKKLVEREMDAEITSLIQAESENARGRILAYKWVLQAPERIIQRSRAANG